MDVLLAEVAFLRGKARYAAGKDPNLLFRAGNRNDAAIAPDADIPLANVDL